MLKYSKHRHHPKIAEIFPNSTPPTSVTAITKRAQDQRRIFRHVAATRASDVTCSWAPFAATKPNFPAFPDTGDKNFHGSVAGRGKTRAQLLHSILLTVAGTYAKLTVLVSPADT